MRYSFLAALYPCPHHTTALVWLFHLLQPPLTSAVGMPARRGQAARCPWVWCCACCSLWLKGLLSRGLCLSTMGSPLWFFLRTVSLSQLFEFSARFLFCSVLCPGAPHLSNPLPEANPSLGFSEPADLVQVYMGLEEAVNLSSQFKPLLTFSSSVIISPPPFLFQVGLLGPFAVGPWGKAALCPLPSLAGHPEAGSQTQLLGSEEISSGLHSALTRSSGLLSVYSLIIPHT